MDPPGPPVDRRSLARMIAIVGVLGMTGYIVWRLGRPDGVPREGALFVVGGSLGLIVLSALLVTSGWTTPEASDRQEDDRPTEGE